MISYLIIGFLVGAALSLTGGGGALLAIPLLMGLVGLSLKVSTFFSLLVVMIASVIGLIFSYKEVQNKISFFLFLGSIVGSFGGNFLKDLASNQMITVLLYLICFYGVYSVWFDKKKSSHQGDSLHQNIKTKKSYFLIISLLSGLFLGILTTLTGLGGGVLLLPLFIKVFTLPQSVAVATSLMTILLSAGTSFLVQFKNITHFPFPTELLGLVLGVFLGNIPIKFLVQSLSVDKVIFIRKVSYGLIVLYTVIALYLKESL